MAKVRGINENSRRIDAEKRWNISANLDPNGGANDDQDQDQDQDRSYNQANRIACHHTSGRPTSPLKRQQQHRKHRAASKKRCGLDDLHPNRGHPANEQDLCVQVVMVKQ